MDLVKNVEQNDPQAELKVNSDAMALKIASVEELRGEFDLAFLEQLALKSLAASQDATLDLYTDSAPVSTPQVNPGQVDPGAG